ncbi:uncharacterized protein G2W53_016269 [Senna tora]|uniref:Uncharacterized protein n=1 Tax=Senna tora TaxID=362788 RepID=A0A834TNN4_9FABA|nr:uncharacterized protein G2W53_016269 [Senna tora]
MNNGEGFKDLNRRVFLALFSPTQPTLCLSHYSFPITHPSPARTFFLRIDVQFHERKWRWLPTTLHRIRREKGVPGQTVQQRFGAKTIQLTESDRGPVRRFIGRTTQSDPGPKTIL